MTNPLLGEVDLLAADKAYVLVFPASQLIALETQTGLSVTKISAKLEEELSLGFTSEVLWFGLRTHHPDLTHADAIELLLALIREHGAIETRTRVVKAFLWQFTPLTEAAKSDVPPPKGPRKAAGNGRASMNSGVN